MEIEVISKENFKKFGTVIEFSENPVDERFEVLITEAGCPWRIAVFRVKNRTCDLLENHPTSMESFEPLKGTGLLFAAENKTPQDYHVFLLDRPVCLNKGVWHQMITLSEETQVKITENLEVNSEFFKLPKPVSVAVV